MSKYCFQKFGKPSKKGTSDADLDPGFMKSRTSSANPSRLSKSAMSLASRRARKDNQENRNVSTDFKDFKQSVTDTRDDVSSTRGLGDTVSMNPPSEPASSRLSMFGNDFMTNRFMMDLPSSKLSWHLESPLGKSFTDWDGTEYDVSPPYIIEQILQKLRLSGC